MDKNLAVSTLFCGQKGLFLTKRAEELAESLLMTKNLHTHPDFLMVQSSKPLGVEEAEQILNKGAMLPCRADNIVIIVKALDTMTVPAQNKLLKFVEDDNHVILIGTSYSDGVIPTLKSRFQCIRCNPYTKKEFSKYLACQGMKDEDVLFYVTGGCPGLLLQEDIKDVIRIFRLAAEAVNGSGSLFEILGLVKEKDNTCFFKMYREYLPHLYSFLGQQLLESGNYSETLYAKTMVIRDHLRICMEQYYNIDCFFEAVAKISEKEETVTKQR